MVHDDVPSVVAIGCFHGRVCKINRNAIKISQSTIKISFSATMIGVSDIQLQTLSVAVWDIMNVPYLQRLLRVFKN